MNAELSPSVAFCTNWNSWVGRRQQMSTACSIRRRCAGRFVEDDLDERWHFAAIQNDQGPKMETPGNLGAMHEDFALTLMPAAICRSAQERQGACFQQTKPCDATVVS